MTGSARLCFITEEEYLAHWNAFHAAVSPWYICPTPGCKFIIPGEPNAFDCYMMHVQHSHVNHGKTGGLVWESGKTTQDSTRWGVSPCFRDVGLKDRHPPPRRIPVEDPGELPVIGARWVVHQQMDSLYRNGFPDDSFLDHQPYWGSIKTGRGEAQTTNINERKKCDGSVPGTENIGKRKSPLATAPPVPSPGRPTKLPRQRDSDWWLEWLDLHCHVGGWWPCRPP